MIRATSLRGLAPLITELGGEPHAVLDRFGIPAESIDDDDGMVSLTAFDRMLDATALEFDCPDLGLRLAERQDLHILGPVAVAIESSTTGAEALESAARFLFVHSPELAIGVGDDPWGRPGIVALTYRKDLAESSYSPQGSELGLGLFRNTTVQLLGGTRGLRSVEIPHSPLSPVERYTRFFGTDVKFNRPEGALCVERRLLDERVASGDPETRRTAIEHLAGTYTDPSSTVQHRTRTAISGILPFSSPDIDTVSRLLSLHPRTLQRRLEAEGTSFARILDDLRRDRTHRYITTTDLPFGRVAQLVGFVEQATLSRAVRRWFGVSPRDLRTGLDTM